MKVWKVNEVDFL